MALFSPSESPAVVVKEVDLTNGVANVPTSTGAFVGNFNWGPCNEPTRINNEATLVSTFGAPDVSNTVDFHSASYYLRYSDDLMVVRSAGDSAKNAVDSDATAILIRNDTHFDTLALDSSVSFISKHPGELGNSIEVHLCTAHSDSAFDGWAYKSSFTSAPMTSDYALKVGGITATTDSDRRVSTIKDECHIVVLDADGELTGSKNQILETFPFVSLAKGAKRSDGTSNFIKNVINNQSSYLRFGNFPQVGLPAKFSENAGETLTAANAATINYTFDSAGGNNIGGNNDIIAIKFNGGVNSGTLDKSHIQDGFDNFEDPNAHLIDFLIAPSMLSATDQVTVVNDLVTTAASIRKDCIVVTSPNRNAVISSTPNTSIVAGVKNFTRSSYLAVDNNFLKVYDKYNDEFINIPAASSTAGLMAATDNNFAPWFSPAGTRRGQYFGVTNLAYSPTKSERDVLYQAGINPIANIPGQGILLFGDKTHLARPSAFDRINVRRLFLVLERAISNAAQNILFEFNDEFTRAEFVNVVEPLLRDVQGRRGITDFKLVCDETNNTPLVIDTNQFIATLFIKPARSINFITLNFTAVRTGVAFEEVVGTVS